MIFSEYLDTLKLGKIRSVLLKIRSPYRRAAATTNTTLRVSDGEMVERVGG